MPGRWIDMLVRRRVAATLVCAAGVAILGVFAIRVPVDNSLKVWFVEDDPALLAYQRFLEQFGNDEVVVTAIHGDADVLDRGRLARLWELSRELKAIDGVARVRSLANIEKVQGSLLGPAVVPVIDPPVRDDDIERAQELLATSALAANLTGRDGESLVVYTWLATGPDADTERGRVIGEIRRATDAALAPGERASHAGVGVLHEAINEVTLSDGTRFVALSYLVIVVALYLITRRVVWTVLALLSVTLADIALLGTMAMTGHSINMVTVALLPLVMILGVANVVHIATEIDASLANDQRSLGDLSRCFKEIVTPCVFNTITTAAGLISLATASMAITRDYGVFGALGVVYAFVFSVVGVAVLLPNATRFRSRGKAGRRISNSVESIMHFSLRHRFAVMTVTIMLALAAVWGITRITVDTESITYLPEDNPARVDTYRVEDAVGPFLPLELTLRTDSAGVWQRAEFLTAVAAAQRALEADPAIGRASSVGDVLRDLHVAVTGEELDRPWAPEDDEDVQNLVELLDRSGHADVLDDWVTEDGRTLRLTATTGMASARTFKALSERARDATQEALGDRAEVSLGGYLPLYSQIVLHTLDGQVSSFTLAFVMVFLVIALVLRSWRYMLVAIPPNLLPVALVLALMGFTGIRLDLATVTVAAVVMGVIEDDTVHILYRLRREIAAGCPYEEAVRRVGPSAGAAVVSTSLIFFAGFLVISLAASDAVANPGLLIAVAVALALAGDLIMLPALASFVFGQRWAGEPAQPAFAPENGGVRRRQLQEDTE